MNNFIDWLLQEPGAFMKIIKLYLVFAVPPLVMYAISYIRVRIRLISKEIEREESEMDRYDKSPLDDIH